MYGSTPPALFPRRGDPVLCAVRAEPVGASPPLWRRLEPACDLYLDKVYGVRVDRRLANCLTDTARHGGPDR
ncbi:hypothetical protein [Nocardiopsis sp. CC223A]|uniref:hypothetical protein n=1 Tax=Nocardiopsis sp. CC223A TaxID=3044051 RepID=UPI00278BCB10|nr:hypothetical protein [Nocardiopsis sp. CC223A]